MLVADLSPTTPIIEILERAAGPRRKSVLRESYGGGLARRLYGWQVDGQIVAVAGVSTGRQNAELLHLATAPGREHHGYASELINAMIKELPIQSLVVETGDDSVGFYRHAGFAVEPISSPLPGWRYRCVLPPRRAEAPDDDPFAGLLVED